MRAAQALGKRVPDDLSIVGFDDIDVARLLTPALTTMAVDKVGMGRVGVQMLINRAQMPDCPRWPPRCTPTWSCASSWRKSGRVNLMGSVLPIGCISVRGNLSP